MKEEKKWKWGNEIHGSKSKATEHGRVKPTVGGPGEHEQTETTGPTRACGGAAPALVPATAMMGGGRAADSQPASCSSSSSSSSSPSGPSTGAPRVHRTKRRPDILNMLMVTNASFSSVIPFASPAPASPAWLAGWLLQPLSGRGPLTDGPAVTA